MVRGRAAAAVPRSDHLAGRSWPGQRTKWTAFGRAQQDPDLHLQPSGRSPSRVATVPPTSWPDRDLRCRPGLAGRAACCGRSVRTVRSPRCPRPGDGKRTHGAAFRRRTSPSRGSNRPASSSTARGVAMGLAWTVACTRTGCWCCCFSF